MKILMTSVFFYPHIGGIETVTEYLADEFTRLGHSVIVVTNTKESGEKIFPYKVLRCPNPIDLFKAYKWCDVFVHQGISLKWVWPWLLMKKPWFIVYHQAYPYNNDINGRIKSFFSKVANNIAVSNVVYNGHALKDGIVIHNSYNAKIFRKINYEKRRGIVYVGKLFRSKGIFLLIDAYVEYKSRTGSTETLTIIGDGTDREEFINYVNSTKYSSDIILLGFRSPREICEILNQSKLQIVPSLDIEAFGLVVLEGLACGCFVIGSDGNGIEEALNNCGMTFKRGDKHDLANKIIDYYNLSDVDKKTFASKVSNHLNNLSLEKVANNYISFFSKYVKNK